MIDGLSGEVRLSDTLTVGPSLTLATFAAFPESASWKSSTVIEGQRILYQRDMMDGAGRPFAVTLAFNGQKLYEIYLSFYARQDTENPKHSIFQSASFHKNWLLEELGEWQHAYPWGFATVGYIASSTPSFACMVIYSSNIEYNGDISQAINFSSNINWSGGVPPD
jgi:hypothetical protein